MNVGTSIGCRKTMLARLPDDGREADYALELTEAEAHALKEVVKDADGRKSETKTARRVLGLQ